MNEQLQTELSKFISTLHSGTEFVADQMPDVLNQLLLWHGLKSFIGFLLFILFVVVCYVAIYHLHKYSKIMAEESKIESKEKHWTYDPTPYVAIWAVPFVITTIAFFIVISDLLTWLQVWLTPKAWIIDYITQMAR